MNSARTVLAGSSHSGREPSPSLSKSPDLRPATTLASAALSGWKSASPEASAIADPSSEAFSFMRAPPDFLGADIAPVTVSPVTPLRSILAGRSGRLDYSYWDHSLSRRVPRLPARDAQKEMYFAQVLEFSRNKGGAASVHSYGASNSSNRPDHSIRQVQERFNLTPCNARMGSTVRFRRPSVQ